MEQLIGHQFGKYQIQEEIGRGMMGAVLKAYDTSLERHVAIKILAPHLTWEAEFVERFVREARTAARLRHPNIVTIYDVGQEMNWHYFVMEYLEGNTLLDQIYKHSPFSPNSVLSILQQLASALDYAHQQGFIHRDVKPANIIVGPDGHATLTDFGIVKAIYESRLTATNVTLGTPEYMAPEHASEGQATASSDLYSLAVIVYEMLCGQVPFRADSMAALIYHIVHQPLPPIRQIRPDLPPSMDTVLSYALAKNPQERYPTGIEFAGAFQQAITGGPVPAPERRRTVPPTVHISIEGGKSPPTPPPATPSREAISTGNSSTPVESPPSWLAPTVVAATPGAPDPQNVATVVSFWGRFPPWLWGVVGTLLVTLLLAPLSLYLFGILGGPEPSPTVIPTPVTLLVTVIPTTQPPEATAVPTAQPTELPTATPTTARSTSVATVTPTPTAGAKVTGDRANLRRGPGTEYGIIDSIARGFELYVVAWASDREGDRWLLVELPGGGRAWLSAVLVEENAASQRISRAATVPPTPIPPTPRPTVIPTPACRSATIKIYAWKEWQDTGIWISAGASIQATASGSWNHGYDPDHCPYWYGPGGCAYSHNNLKAPGQYVGSLIARVDSRRVVVVGTGLSWQADTSGNLQMCMNDAVGAHEDNDGNVTVSLTICP